MAIDNSLYNSLENTYFKIKDYLENTQLGREHSPMIVKQEELADLLERFDIEALEEQSKDIHRLHDQLNAIKEVSTKIVVDLGNSDDSVTTAEKVVSGLDEVFDKIEKIVL
ncbi:MAG: hypothetical protein OEW60_00585 [Thiovulaceae bacterium]|nr:hypothetical protein [Sulfurimonadaceae bacterium]